MLIVLYLKLLNSQSAILAKHGRRDSLKDKFNN